MSREPRNHLPKYRSHAGQSPVAPRWLIPVGLLACAGMVTCGMERDRTSRHAGRGEQPVAAGAPSPEQLSRERPGPFLAIRIAAASCGDSLAREAFLAAWQDSLRISPEDPRADYAVGLVCLAQGEDSLALIHLRRLTAAGVRDPVCHSHLAEAARRTGTLPAIVADVTHSFRDAPTGPGHLAAGMIFLELAAWDSALTCGRAALSTGTEPGEAHLLLARALRGKGRLEEAAQEATAAASLAAREGDHELHVRSLDALCITHRARGERVRSTQVGNEALLLCLQYGLRHLEAPIRCELGYMRLRHGDGAGAGVLLQRALAVADSTGDRRSLGWALKFLGDARVLQGDLAGAEALLGRALVMLRAVRDQEGPAACLDALAGVAAGRGQVRKASAHFQEALALHRARRDGRAEGATLVNLASSWLEHGELADAVRSFHQAIRVAADGRDSMALAAGSIGLGNAYLAMGDLARADESLQRGLALARVRHDTVTMARALGAIGALEFRRGNLGSSRDRFQLAGRLFERLGDRRSMAAAFMNAGMSHLHDAPRRAASSIREALEVFTSCHDAYGGAVAWAALGEISLAAGRIREADSLFSGCLDRAVALGAPDLTCFAQYGVARCREAADDWEGSLAMYAAAMSTVEHARIRLPAHEWRFGFLATTVKIPERYIGLLAELDDRWPARGFARRAFDVAEAAKARSFLELLGESERRRVRHDDPDAEIEAILVMEISGLSRALWHLPEGSPRADALSREVARREDELNRLQSLSGDSGRRDATPPDHSLDLLQNAMGTAGVALLLEYVTGEAGSFLWVVRPDTALMQRVPARGRLAELVGPLIDAMRMPPRLGTDEEAGLRTLAEAVLPSPDWFGETRGRICIVPDGPLYHVPFETLPVAMDSSGSARMIECGPVSYAPSAAVLLSIWDRGPPPAGDAVLAVGIRDAHGLESAAQGDPVSGARTLPPLRYAEAEAESVCAAFTPGRCTSVIGSDATEGRVVHELQEPYSIAHLATHALIDPEAPRSSCIVLNPGPGGGNDGVLVFDEILQLSSSPGLVVLSSCESALGELISGEGMVSLSRAFFHAGARAVLVTLWPVNDRSTATWMREFYGQIAAGASPAQAVRAAKLRFLHGDVSALRHPYYWAPVVLIGGV